MSRGEAQAGTWLHLVGVAGLEGCSRSSRSGAETAPASRAVIGGMVLAHHATLSRCKMRSRMLPLIQD